jgi:hypothetical protein
MLKGFIFSLRFLPVWIFLTVLFFSCGMADDANFPEDYSASTDTALQVQMDNDYWNQADYSDAALSKCKAVFLPDYLPLGRSETKLFKVYSPGKSIRYFKLHLKTNKYGYYYFDQKTRKNFVDGDGKQIPFLTGIFYADTALNLVVSGFGNEKSQLTQFILPACLTSSPTRSFSEWKVDFLGFDTLDMQTLSVSATPRVNLTGSETAEEAEMKMKMDSVIAAITAEQLSGETSVTAIIKFRFTNETAGKGKRTFYVWMAKSQGVVRIVEAESGISWTVS